MLQRTIYLVLCIHNAFMELVWRQQHCNTFFLDDEKLRIRIQLSLASVSEAPVPPCSVVRSAIRPLCVRMYADAELCSDQHMERHSIYRVYVLEIMKTLFLIP